MKRTWKKRLLGIGITREAFFNKRILKVCGVYMRNVERKGGLADEKGEIREADGTKINNNLLIGERDWVLGEFKLGIN